MPWARFTERFVFVPDEDRRVAVVYKAGHEGPVRDQCLQKAEAAGKAVKIDRPAPKAAE